MNDFTTNAGIVGGCMFLVAFTACVGLTPFVVAWKLRERKEAQRNRRIDATTDRQLTAAKASHTEMHRAALVGKGKP